MIETPTKIELDKVFIEMLAPQILMVQVKESFIIEAKDVYAIKKANLELANNKEYGFIVSGGNYSSVSSEARKLMTTKEIKHKRAGTALVLNSLPHRILANFYITINKPIEPTKIFSTNENALIWLKKILQE